MSAEVLQVDPGLLQASGKVLQVSAGVSLGKVLEVMAEAWLTKEVLELERRCRARRGMTRKSSRHLFIRFAFYQDRVSSCGLGRRRGIKKGEGWREADGVEGRFSGTSLSLVEAGR